MTGPKAHGFLFKAAMILAILERRKTQTRRAVTVHNSLIDGTGYGIRKHWPKLQWDRAWVDKGPSPAGNPGQYWKVPCHCMGTDDREQVVHRVYPRVQPGDTVWCRETWATYSNYDHVKPTLLADNWPIRYRAGGGGLLAAKVAGKWRSALHMPRWATRLELPVLQVRAQLVQEIDNNDADAEGTPDLRTIENNWDLRDCFAHLWDSINGARHGLTWADSPPVWVYQWAPPE